MYASSSRRLDLVPYLYPSCYEEALVDLQGVLGELGGRVRGLVERLHVLDVHDAPTLVYVGDGERDQGVLHPERELLLSVEDNEHTGVLCQSGAPHQPSLTLGICGR